MAFEPMAGFLALQLSDWFFFGRFFIVSDTIDLGGWVFLLLAFVFLMTMLGTTKQRSVG